MQLSPEKDSSPSSPGTSREGGALQVDSTEENRHLGYFRFPLHNKATFKKILFPRTKQNKTKNEFQG